MILQASSPAAAAAATSSLASASSSSLAALPHTTSNLKPCPFLPSPHRSTRPSLSLVRAQNGDAHQTKAFTGVIFEPFVEAQNQLVKVASISSESFARQHYAAACEAAVNDQINVEYSVSYVYHALFAYFDRDNVGLPGFANFFKNASDEERNHAEKFMKYQNVRGGRVKLQSIMLPGVTEFDHPEKGDALYAMEVSLAMEKLVNEKLLRLDKVAAENNDAEMQDFVEAEFLHSQVQDIKKISEYVSQLRRVGKGHGVYHFDLMLQEENRPAIANGAALANGAAA